MQNQDQNSIYFKCKDIIPKHVLKRKNKAHTWSYGYNEKYDVVVISRNSIGEILYVSGVRIALP